MTDDTSQKPRRGRPPAKEQGAALTTWVRISEYEKLVRLANRKETSVSSLVRSLLLMKLPR
jgi:hypothetical protein